MPITSLSIRYLLVITGAVSLAIVFFLVTYTLYRPIVRHLGVRQAFRRPLRSVSMILGLTLSVAIITASFGLQDSLNASRTANHLRLVGAADETISGTFTSEQVIHALTTVRGSAAIRTASALYMGQLQARSTIAASNLVEYGVPADFDTVYGTSYDINGHPLSLASVPSRQVILSITAARSLGVRTGDVLRLSAGNVTETFRVYGVLNHDIALTTGEVVADLSFPEIIMPLSTAQLLYRHAYNHELIPNIIAIRNTGMTRIADAAQSRQVLNLLQDIFGVVPLDPSVAHATHFPTPFETTIIHPLNPRIVTDTAGIPVLSTKAELIGSPAARQFFLLFPIFTHLLVGAGMLLLVLLNLLQAEERRMELGIARGVGLPRSDLVISLLLESCCYMAVALVTGTLLGIALVAGELHLLTALPQVGLPSSGAGSGPLSLVLSVRWESLLLAAAMSCLVICLVMVAIATWVSHMNIVAAIRSLDPVSLRTIPRTVWQRVVLFTWHTGFLWLVPMAVAWFLWFRVHTAFWQEIGSLAGAWALGTILPQVVRIPFLGKLLQVAVGIFWILVGLRFGMPQFILAFATNSTAGGQQYLAPDVSDALISLVALVIGGVCIAMGSMQGIAGIFRMAFGHMRWVRPSANISLMYPTIYRARTWLVLTLFGLVTFLTMAVITNNFSTITQQQASLTTGGYQVEVDVPPSLQAQFGPRLLQTSATMPRDIAAVATAIPLYDLVANKFMPIQLGLPGHPRYSAPGPTVVDDRYLETTSLPMFVRAKGYDTDRSVWQALRNAEGLGVLQYQGGIGLPLRDGFHPFTATLLSSGHIPYTVTIIGIVPNSTNWATVFLSRNSADAMRMPLEAFPTAYYFRLVKGENVVGAEHSLGQAFRFGDYGLSAVSLGNDDQNNYTQVLTLFLAAYLTLGLLFGALSIGIITNRNVVERKQQIGMLRALGFSRGQVIYLFILESGFVITLAFGLGLGLAWYLVMRVNSAFSRHIPFPFVPVGVLLAGIYLTIFICIWVPAKRAARVPPAEALRYE